MLILLPLLLFLNGNLHGLVVGVNDGDTITILAESRTVRVRLFGIDCPEQGQAFGQAAKKRVSALCARSVVRVQPKGKDAFGRTLGIVFLADGRNRCPPNNQMPLPLFVRRLLGY